MNRLYLLSIAALAGACASSPQGAPGQAVKVALTHGEQLRLADVDAQLIADTFSLRGQVIRKALPRGPLREHVHLNVVSDSGEILSVHDVQIYPHMALRSSGFARINLTTPSSVVPGDASIQLHVVAGVPHDG